MPRTITLPPGERTRVLHLFSDSIPRTITFTAETPDGTPPEGTIEVVRPGGSTAQALAPSNSIQKGFTDWNYSVYVTAERTCAITMPGGLLQGKTLFLIIGAVVLFALISGGMAALSGGTPPMPE